METTYRHTQVSRATLGLMGAALAVVVWGSLRTSDPVLATTSVLVGFVLVLFSTLTVTVRDGALDVFFGPGLIRRRIPVRRLRDVRVVRTPWYYGWGIRLTPAGWLWNVSGLDGVEVQFHDGHCFRIGSDEPNRLAEALLRAMRAGERVTPG
jgi:hypothetical protein